MGHKEELTSIYTELEKALRDYVLAHNKFLYGKNKKERSIGEKETEYILDKVKSKIFNNEILHSLFKSHIEESGDNEVFFIDEFFDWNYFHKDMPEFISYIKSKTDTLNPSK